MKVHVIIAIGCTAAAIRAHDWHRHDPPAPAPVSIPASQGAPPANSAAVAARALSVAPFFPKVRYWWDASSFYIESDGVPAHDMMKGITAWQQQLPVPQRYYGTNAWRLPLLPVKTGNVAMGRTTLFRGAMAIAVNGIPIFNPIKNDGVTDTFLAGELDEWGGHCGRADDYHYHVTPWHLAAVVGDRAPLAYALDGFPIYGEKEQDGSAVNRATLDALNGHDHGDGLGYHYHGSRAYPYINGGVHLNPPLVRLEAGTGGNTAEQIEPQPFANGVRPALSGLAGVAITGFTRASADDYTVTYTRAGGTYTVRVRYDRAAGSVRYTYNDLLYGTRTLDETHTGWTPQPQTRASSLALLTQPDGTLSFTMSGEPGRGYALFAGSDLTSRPVFGYRLLDSTGTSTFDLSPVGPRGFFSMPAAIEGTYVPPIVQPPAQWSMLALPDTGQTDSFSAVFGEDHDYTIRPMSFTDHGNGTVTDNVTGLMWQKADGGEMTWQAAQSYCTNLVLGGHSDWRVPSSHELFSIAHLNRSQPPMDAAFISPATAQYWWASDPRAGSTTNAWALNSGGGIGPKPIAETISAGGTFAYHIRAVRDIVAQPGPAGPGPRLSVNADGTVTDANTGLVWQQAEAAAPMTWEAALAYSEGLSLAGKSDWRLPNAKELFSLVDVTKTAPSIDTTAFPGVPATQNENLYWSSSTNYIRPGEPWYVDFRFGLVAYKAGTNLLRVKCVRGGEP